MEQGSYGENVRENVNELNIRKVVCAFKEQEER